MNTKTSKHTGFQSRIGYHFKDRNLLTQALRHPSRSGEDNQRLEFLGDRVLGLVIAQALYERFPEMNEGALAPRFNHLVRKERCAEVAQELQLGNELVFGRSEAMSGGRTKTAPLGDALEAVIAAIYLDGGFLAAQKFILQHWEAKLDTLPSDTIDNKSKLQEFVQARDKSLPIYEELERTGPDHAPKFVVAVSALSQRATGQGHSKRKAEQEAAALLLKKLETLS